MPETGTDTEVELEAETDVETRLATGTGTGTGTSRLRPLPPLRRTAPRPPTPPSPAQLSSAQLTTAISRAVSFSRRPPDSVHVTMSSIRTPKRPGR